jgi:hypothetical protein
MSPDQFEQLAAPLREEAKKLHERLAAIDVERNDVLDQLRRIDGALSRLFPEPGKKKMGRPRGPRAPSTNGRMVSDSIVEEVLAFIEAHEGYQSDGFVAGPVAKAMNLSGRPVGKDTVRKAVLVLHDRGVIRAVRKTGGGGTLYKVVGR